MHVTHGAELALHQCRPSDCMHKVLMRLLQGGAWSGVPTAAPPWSGEAGASAAHCRAAHHTCHILKRSSDVLSAGLLIACTCCRRACCKPGLECPQLRRLGLARQAPLPHTAGLPTAACACRRSPAGRQPSVCSMPSVCSCQPLSEPCSFQSARRVTACAYSPVLLACTRIADCMSRITPGERSKCLTLPCTSHAQARPSY